MGPTGAIFHSKCLLWKVSLWKGEKVYTEGEVNKLENVYVSLSHTAPPCRDRCPATQKHSPLLLHNDASLLPICAPSVLPVLVRTVFASI